MRRPQLPELKLSRKNFWLLILALVAVSLFSPKGLFRLMVMKQEILRIENDTKTLDRDIASLTQEIADFKHSPQAKERAIRSELGFLRDNEWSVEFPSNSHE